MTATLTSLPNELLHRIFDHLDHEDLYTQSKTCRTLHFITLHVLFQRHFSGFSSHRLDLDLDGAPTRSLLAGLQSALFSCTDNIHHISIVFSMNVSLLYAQSKTLTALVSRLQSVKSLRLFLGRLEPWHGVRNGIKKPVLNLDKLSTALQGLMNAAFAKGCTELTVSSGRALRYVRRGRIRGRIADGFRGFARQVGDVLTRTETGRPNMIWKGLDRIPALSSLSSRTMVFPSCRSVCIIADLLIHPSCLNWTLRFLNHGHLTTLVVRWSGFSWEALRRVLPKIYIPRLESFTFSGWDGTFPDLILFAQKHSCTISFISVFMAHSRFLDLTLWETGRTKLHLNFPNLRHIELASFYLPWFFEAVMTNPTKHALRSLPGLSHITIVPRSLESSDVPNLDPGFASIAQLIETSSTTGNQPDADWLSHLTFDLMGGPSLFLSWSQSYITMQQMPSNHTPMLHMIKNLKITNFYTLPNLANFEDSFFQILPRFCALFPNLIMFHLRWIGVESLKKRIADEQYWRWWKESCPKLEVVRFNDSVELNMADLLKETYALR